MNRVEDIIKNTMKDVTTTAHIGNQLIQSGARHYNTVIGGVSCILSPSVTSGMRKSSTKITFKLNGKVISRKKLEALLNICNHDDISGITTEEYFTHY